MKICCIKQPHSNVTARIEHYFETRQLAQTVLMQENIIAEEEVDHKYIF